MSDSVSRILARHMAESRFELLPEREVEAARTSLIDIVAVGLAARGLPCLETILSADRLERSQGESTIWVTGERAAPRQAGFVNSVSAALLDYDSVFHRGVVHADLVIVPTAIAVAEAAGASGKDLLTAIAYGNDLLCRLSLITPPPRKGWFFTSVYGVIASAAVTARLLGCDATQVANAMGLALFSAGGTYQPMTERSASKQVMAAFAVQAGIQCGYLAAAGFEGVTEPLEGPYGVLAMYQDGDLSIVTRDLGQVFLGSQSGLKPYPSCQCNHAPIEGILTLQREEHIDTGAVSEIEVFLSPHACRVVGAPYDSQPPTQMSAQFSVQYSIACALLRGGFGIPEILPPAIEDATIMELARRVRIVEDAANPNTYVPSTVTVHMRDGRRFLRTVTVNRGGVEQPLDRVEMLAKFMDCLSAFDPVINREDVERRFLALESIGSAEKATEVIARAIMPVGA